MLQTIITIRLGGGWWEDTWVCHIRLSHIQEAGRKYCSAFVTFIFIFSLPFLITEGPPYIAGSSRCEGNQVFVKEADVVIRGAREMARLTAGSLTECTDKCRSDSLDL